MSRVKKILLIIAFAFFILLLNSENAQAASKSQYLNNWIFDVQVNSDGSMNVTETWDVEIRNTNTLFKTFDLDKTKFSGIKNVSVTEVTNGQNKTFGSVSQWMEHVTKDCYFGGMNHDGQFEIAWGVGLDNSRDTRKYKISYTVQDAISKNPDCYELYWQFVGKKFKISADRITGTIRLPQSATNKEDIRVWGHTEDLNGEIHVTSNNTVSFDIKDFVYGKFVEVRVAIPSYFNISSGRTSRLTLQNIIDEETKWANEANERRESKRIAGIAISGFLSVVSVIFIILILKNTSKKKIQLNEMVKFIPTQPLQYFRDIPDSNASPGETILLIKQKVQKFMSTEIGDIFSATLLELSLKKALDFNIQYDARGKEIIIIRLFYNNSLSLQRPDEKAIYNFLIQASANTNYMISFDDLGKYIKKHSSKVVELKDKLDREAEETLNLKRFIDVNEKIKQTKSQTAIALYILATVYSAIGASISGGLGSFAIYPIIGLCLASIYGLVISKKFSNKINVFTQFGVDEGEKWKGLKNFMANFSTMERKYIPEVVIWEQYLVYATAFGMADQVIKQLKEVYPEIVNNVNFNSGVYVGHMMHSNFSSSLSHSISSAMSSTYSSATGGGGGFSGGGGGGRRPEAAEAVVKIYLI